MNLFTIVGLGWIAIGAVDCDVLTLLAVADGGEND